MRDYFHHLAELLTARLTGAEVLLLSFTGEASDFVRFNRNRVRQAGSVLRRTLTLELVEGRRHALAQTDLAGNAERDLAELKALLGRLRAQLRLLPEDPYLNYATEVRNSEHSRVDVIPAGAEALEQIVSAAHGLDLVGIWASGELNHGFANSLGQRNWHGSATFNLDWSLYHAGDKAVKANYAGFTWSTAHLEARMAHARQELAQMQRPPKAIDPGRYRAYLAPAALQEIMDLMAWGGFGLKSHRTAETPLIKMITEQRRLHRCVSIQEDHARGLTPPFSDVGFIKPAAVNLIEQGVYRDCLVDPRSGREYGASVNAASEYPESLAMAPGSLARDDICEALGTGLLINNLWYGNFSDRNNCRLTGMTRFACFWVEDGIIQAPLNVMRFDETVYNLLGDHLLGLSAERELIFDNSSYGGRSYRSYLLPGALVDGMAFTL